MAAIALVAMPCVDAQTSSLQLIRPAGVAYDSGGDLFVADSARNQVLEISAGGTMTVVAGSGVQGFSGDGGSATAAELNSPTGVAVDSDGTLYIADMGNQRIRVVRSGGIATFTGNGSRGYSGDNGPAASASLNHPVTLAIDSSGALLIVDEGNERVRRVSAGQISTIAGDGMQGFAGDGGAATAAELNEPSGIAAAGDGRIFVADSGNQRVRVINKAGVISTYAGTGVAGSTGDNGAATAAQLDRPSGLALDAADTLYIADEDNHRLRRVGSDGNISTVVGSGVQGAEPDGSVALSTSANQPIAAAVSSFGWPAIADSANHSVQILYSDGKLYNIGGSTARSTTLSQAAPNAVYGSGQTVVTATAVPGTAQGSITILDGATAIATGSLAQGAATIALPKLSAGTHTLTAVYSGDGLHPSASTTSPVIISPAPVTATPANATVVYGTPLPALTGTLAGVLPQDQSAVSAVFTSAAPTPAPVGNYPISATLTGSGSSNYTLSPAANSGTLTVVPAGTVATLAPPSAAYATLPIELTARVASATSGTPTGTVEFFDGGNLIASAPLVNGSASAVELNPGSGNHTLSIAYSGDANFRSSNSANVTEAVAALPDFNLGVTGNKQQSSVAGSAANFNLTVASQGSPFTGAVTFSATGLPAGATVSFSPPEVVPGGATAAVTMSVVAPATTAYRAVAPPELAFAVVAAICLFALRRRRTVSRLLVLVVAAGLFSLTGCGARVAPESVLPVHTYPLMVQATGTNLAGNVVVHTVSVTLAVE